MNRKNIPKGWRLLRYGEKLTHPFKIIREYGNGSIYIQDGDSGSSAIGKYRNRNWSKVIVPKAEKITISASVDIFQNF